VEDLTEELEARDVRLTGFLVLDHEHEEDYDIEPSELVYMCMHCLLDMRPELGRAFDLAKEHGEAHRVDGEWRAVRVA